MLISVNLLLIYGVDLKTIAHLTSLKWAIYSILYWNFGVLWKEMRMEENLHKWCRTTVYKRGREGWMRNRQRKRMYEKDKDSSNAWVLV